jgi:hypothetical protein
LFLFHLHIFSIVTFSWFFLVVGFLQVFMHFSLYLVVLTNRMCWVRRLPSSRTCLPPSSGFNRKTSSKSPSPYAWYIALFFICHGYFVLILLSFFSFFFSVLIGSLPMNRGRVLRTNWTLARLCTRTARLRTRTNTSVRSSH